MKDKIKILKYRLHCLALVCLPALLAACGEETSETVPQPQPGITIELAFPPPLKVETRASSLGGVTVEDVWVVQYNATSGSFIKSKMLEGNKGTPGLNNNILTFDTSSGDFSQVTSRFYVIVNAGANFLDGFNGSEAELMKKAIPVTGSITGELKLLTTGPVDYTPAANGKVVVVAPLRRAYAKVSVKWDDTDANGTFTISKMTIRNYPKNMALYTRGGGGLDSTYPPVADINATASATINNMASGTPYEFYMPENLRGMGNAPSFADKGLATYGPKGSLAGCTSILLEGTYKYENYLENGSGTTGTSAALNVAYCIYLGTNLKTDYNIQRNYLYNVTLNLSGANTADVRVQITDGKVAVFDKVEEITHTIKFE